jgi:hypothetical protein
MSKPPPQTLAKPRWQERAPLIAASAAIASRRVARSVIAVSILPVRPQSTQKTP